jgi:hypothetical protein
MLNIFISYRRDDSAGYAGRLADSLEAKFGSGRIFRDVEDINPGDNFINSIEHNLKQAAVTLVVIGKNWLSAKDSNGLLRLQNPQDFVRLEIESALKLGHQIIPILIDNTTMPNAHELPESIAAIAYRQALVCSDTRWSEDINRLYDVLLGLEKKSNPLPTKTRFTIRTLAIVSATLVMAGLIYFLSQYFLITPDLSGNWYFKDGDYLLIKQDGNHFEIEHTDPRTQTTYEKGTGIIKNRRLRFNLEPIYTTQFRYRAELTLSPNRERLKGKLIEVLSNQVTVIELTRMDPSQKPEISKK